MRNNEYIAAAMQYGIKHLERIAEDLKNETDEKETLYYLQEAKATADAMRWEVDGNIRNLSRALKDKKISRTGSNRQG